MLCLRSSLCCSFGSLYARFVWPSKTACSCSRVLFSPPGLLFVRVVLAIFTASYARCCCPPAFCAFYTPFFQLLAIFSKKVPLQPQYQKHVCRQYSACPLGLVHASVSVSLIAMMSEPVSSSGYWPCYVHTNPPSSTAFYLVAIMLRPCSCHAKPAPMSQPVGRLLGHRQTCLFAVFASLEVLAERARPRSHAALVECLSLGNHQLVLQTPPFAMPLRLAVKNAAPHRQPLCKQSSAAQATNSTIHNAFTTCCQSCGAA